MKVLFISNLFPDATEPTRGLDNARLVRELAKSCDIRVLALRPVRGIPPLWRPKTFRRRVEDEALDTVYCRAAYIPRFGSRFNHLLMARSIRRPLAKIRDQFPFDRVLCSWVYPDGCAVAELARKFGFRFVIIAQGSDVHQYLNMPARRRIIIPALNHSSGVITRSGDLAQLLCTAGVEESKLRTIYNGVDFDLFHPGDQSEARRELGLPPAVPMILYVGNFFPIKNPLRLVAAHAEINRPSAQGPCHLVMLGDGPLRTEILQRAGAAGTSARLLLPGRKPPVEVSRYLRAANVLCVPSDNEGVPNVILEAFACGLRTVATKVGGIPEVLNQDYLGRLVAKGDTAALSSALAEVLATPADRQRIVEHARQFSWPCSAGEYLGVLQGTLADRNRSQPSPASAPS